MRLHAGRLRHRVTIQYRIDIQNSSGGIVPLWRDLAVVWAEIVPSSAREFIQSAALQSEIVARITIRYLYGLDATMRILHGEKIYNPRAWLPDSISGVEYLTAPCTEGLNQG